MRFSQALMTIDQHNSGLSENVKESKESKPLRVVCIDDDANVTAALARRLKSHNLEVIASTSAKNGYWNYLVSEPDVIITDLSMPGVNGVEMIESIRRHEKGQQIPIIVLSGLATKDVANRLKALGVNEVLGKPATTEDIVRAIRSSTCLAG